MRKWEKCQKPMLRESSQVPQKRAKIKTSQEEHNLQAIETQLDLRNIPKPSFSFQRGPDRKVWRALPYLWTWCGT
jgi:hypothetical protein